MQFPVQEQLWLSCAAKRCCSVRTVLPTGADIWRIATQLEIPPESFLRPVPAPPSADDGFVLAPTGQPFQAVLARRALKGRNAACVFLMVLGDRVARCGLAELRPLSCQAFPAVGPSASLHVDDNAPCTCRAWTLADLDRARARLLLGQEERERQHYRELIRAWNAHVSSAENVNVSFQDFCRYILDAYAQHPPTLEPRGAL